MSATERAVGVVKNVLMFRETLERIQTQLGELHTDLAALSRSHVELSERVARMEGFIEGAAAVSKPRLPRK